MKDNKDNSKDKENEDKEREEVKNIKVPEWVLEYIKSQQKPDETISDTVVRLLGVIPTIDRCLAFASDKVRERAKEVKKIIEEIIGDYRIKFVKARDGTDDDTEYGTENYIYVSQKTNHQIAKIIFRRTDFWVAYRDRNDEWDKLEGARIYDELSEREYESHLTFIKEHVEGAHRRWGIKENQWEKIDGK